MAFIAVSHRVDSLEHAGRPQRLVQLLQGRLAAFQAGPVPGHGSRIGGKLLAQGDGHRILQMGPARLEDVIELPSLCRQCLGELRDLHLDPERPGLAAADPAS